MLVMLAVAWPVTRMCDHHDAIGKRETLAREDHPIFTSRVARIPYSSPSPGGGSVAGQGNIRGRARSAELWSGARVSALAAPGAALPRPAPTLPCPGSRCPVRSTALWALKGVICSKKYGLFIKKMSCCMSHTFIVYLESLCVFWKYWISHGRFPIVHWCVGHTKDAPIPPPSPPLNWSWCHLHSVRSHLYQGRDSSEQMWKVQGKKTNF